MPFPKASSLPADRDYDHVLFDNQKLLKGTVRSGVFAYPVPERQDEFTILYNLIFEDKPFESPQILSWPLLVRSEFGI